jgi:hypothetical protein
VGEVGCDVTVDAGAGCTGAGCDARSPGCGPVRQGSGEGQPRGLWLHRFPPEVLSFSFASGLEYVVCHFTSL